MTQSQTRSPAVSELLHTPEFFLANVAPESRALVFLKSSRDVLQSASFLDGRTNLSVDGKTYRLGIDDVRQYRDAHEITCAPSRFIFHVSFCGSTLLARACSVPGKSFCYKEPQALIDLATIKARHLPLHSDAADWSLLQDTVLQKLGTPWEPTETAVIKPSNWVNTILPELTSRPGSRAVFLTMEPEEFLIAVLRGGQERIRYVCNLLAHLEQAFPAYSTLIREASAPEIAPLESIARLVLLALEIQLSAFRSVRDSTSTMRSETLSYRMLTESPEAAVALTAQTLDLPFDPSDPEASVRRVFSRHSKQTDRSFERTDAAAVDRAVAREYQAVVRAAIDWYSQRVSGVRAQG
jgi:hypothetical protein